MESMSCTDLRDLSHGGSFSFSCSESDLNFSSLSHFTDDDEDDDDADADGSSDDGSYIEIALDHHDILNQVVIEMTMIVLLPEHSTHTHQNISEPPKDQPVNQTTSSSASCTLSSSSTESSDCGARKEGSDLDRSMLQRSTATKRGRLPAVNGLVNTLLFGLRSSSELPIHADNADVARSRKATNMRSSINGGIMKLLFKFRAMNLGALVASVVKPRQVACDDRCRSKKKTKSKKSVLKPLDKWMAQKKQGKRKGSEEGEGEEKYSRVVEINLGAVRGVLEAIGNSMSTGIGRKDRRTRSCPSSIKSSPIHNGFASDERNKVYVYARETSIQAAIAHFLLIGVLRVLFRLMKEMWLKPTRIRSVLWKQGIRGPPPSFIAGNVPEMQKIQSSNQKPYDANHVHHNWVPSIFPYLQRWEQLYGPVYVYATGSKQHLYVSDPKLLKELKLQNYMDLGVPRYLSKPLQPLIGDSIIRANGQDFAYQKKVIAPEFFLNKVKGMVCLMEASAVTFLKTWESRVLESEGGVVDIKVDEELKTLSADIISRACFGSSYSQGNQIFAKIAILQEALSNPSLLFGFLNFSLFPTESEKKIKSLRKEVDALLLKLVRDRQKESQSGGTSEKDLLQMILQSAANNSTDKPQQYMHKTDQFILDNCRSIYFAGSETTALTASWTLMLLALHPEWQERVRVEIAEVCGDDDDQLLQCLKDMDNLSKLKTLTMVIQESLRLYGPGVILAREL
ncbi:cytochrome P450 714A1-like [Prunus yedoensis var. nudiflora]|uniref:Cytochrome P450 714A1-like n=1 Tax=Prunus yedoensis var. nudiflora TaxID=2094558 RepID=A0A314YXE0_PRUYE|nr:cytochrome P450 714A1-like [Prunus yedoensis var. nudiflora]